jgi:predicted nucleic acid-binding protein
VILADTSVWIDHFRYRNERLHRALVNGDVAIHPFVIGELALGNFQNRVEVMRHLGKLPTATQASHTEVIGLVEDRRLMGRGIGYIDAHLLASVLLTPATRLWTLDKRLQSVGASLGVVL